MRSRPSEYENFTEALKKLRETSTIKDYQTKLENLANKTHGLSKKFIKSCFINGLKEQVRGKIKMHALETMKVALVLAKLVEERKSINVLGWPQVVNGTSMYNHDHETNKAPTGHLLKKLRKKMT